jgi:hypothetical protein
MPIFKIEELFHLRVEKQPANYQTIIAAKEVWSDNWLNVCLLLNFFVWLSAILKQTNHLQLAYSNTVHAYCERAGTGIQRTIFCSFTAEVWCAGLRLVAGDHTRLAHSGAAASNHLLRGEGNGPWP